jgi:hypothetical protein
MPGHRSEVEEEDGWTRWVQPVPEGYRMSCCDCGLVHEMDFRIYEGRPQFRARRHKRATAAMRAWKKRKSS